ncbi:hypothetical protein [Candidatus Poriferisodalis sp.]|uniref:hypothetical protein n=1 Tax=Candidatus Poriferisodalis sp. TaxID=3101277 RepID=UPI003B01A85E
MRNLRMASVRSPFDKLGLASPAVAALSRAESMGLLRGQVTCLDYSALEQLRSGLAEAGIGQGFLAELAQPHACEPDRLSTLMARIAEALEQSPAPGHEWPAVVRVLGIDLLVRLLGISPSSARRYLCGDRTTPDEVAVRLHFLALVVGDLAGAYNDIGIRRWFDRPRARLGGATPAEALGEEWFPEDPAARSVRDLASSIMSSPAT